MSSNENRVNKETPNRAMKFECKYWVYGIVISKAEEKILYKDFSLGFT